MDGTAKVNCIHAGTDYKGCKEWLAEHAFCNGCPSMTPELTKHDKDRGYTELAFDLAVMSRAAQPHIVKRFKLTMEMLQDEPEKVKSVVLDYLTPHSDKIHKLEVEQEVEEETLAPVLVLRIWLIPAFAPKPQTWLNRLLKVQP